MARKGKEEKVWCYVLTQEHYHFPPNDNDMVAATPRIVVVNTPESHEYIKIQAHRMARELMEKFSGEIKEFQSLSEYRVWVDSPNSNCDKFVYVVRKVEYRN